MKTYAIRIEGTGIDFPAEEGAASAIGFFTTRWVKATSPASARDLAKQLVLSEWAQSGEYGPANSGLPPELVVEEIWEIGAFRALFVRKPAGYSFYASE
ncbi:hypothetical protein ACW5EG_17040 [Luteimonas sp. A611]